MSLYSSSCGRDDHPPNPVAAGVTALDLIAEACAAPKGGADDGASATKPAEDCSAFAEPKGVCDDVVRDDPKEGNADEGATIIMELYQTLLHWMARQINMNSVASYSQ